MIEKPDSVHLDDRILKLVEKHRQHLRPQPPLIIGSNYTCPPSPQDELQGRKNIIPVKERLDRFEVPTPGSDRGTLFDAGSKLASIASIERLSLNELLEFFNGKVTVVSAHNWSTTTPEAFIEFFRNRDAELTVFVPEQASIANRHAANARGIFYFSRSRDSDQEGYRRIFIPWIPTTKNQKYLRGEADWFAAGLLWEEKLRNTSIIPDAFRELAKARLELLQEKTS
jgi:hypothetical protein